MGSFEYVWGVADLWDRIALLALIVAALVMAAFVIEYVGRRKWWLSFVGRALATERTILCAALWLTLVNTFWAYPYEEQISAGIMVLLAAGIIYQFVSLLRTPRNGRRSS